MKVALLLASALGVWAAFCDDADFVATPANWDDAPCQTGKALKWGLFKHSTKMRWCFPKEVTDKALTFEMKHYPTADCKEHKCLQKVAAKCGYAYGETTGFNMEQLHKPICPTATDECRAAIDAALVGAYDGETCTDVDVKKYLNWIKPNCAKKVDTCQSSEFGCCQDGVTKAPGAFNKGCCDYEKFVMGGVCAQLDEATGRGHCGDVDGVDECTATTQVAGGGTPTSNNPRRASMVTNPKTGKPFQCYCDEACDVTKDCCDGISTDYCHGVTGKFLEAHPWPLD